LRSAIGLKDRVVFAGVGDRVELWLPEVLEANSADALETYAVEAEGVFVAKGIPGVVPGVNPGPGGGAHS
jgi:hypothetical protein